MKKHEILKEMHLLDSYLKNQTQQLPNAVYQIDTGIQTAKNRLTELKKMLDDEIVTNELKKNKEQKVISESSNILNTFLDALKDEVALFDTKISSLHQQHKARAYEVTTELKRLLR